MTAAIVLSLAAIRAAREAGLQMRGFLLAFHERTTSTNTISCHTMKIGVNVSTPDSDFDNTTRIYSRAPHTRASIWDAYRGGSGQIQLKRKLGMTLLYGFRS